MTRYAKAIVAVIGVAATFIYTTWGADFGLSADWPAMAVAALTPIAVFFFPNA